MKLLFATSGYFLLGAALCYIVQVAVTPWNNINIETFRVLPPPSLKRRVLPSKPRILCYINTIPVTYFTKAVHVNRTWAHRCTKTIFFSSTTEHTIPITNLNLTKPESRMHLWSKMRTALRYIYKFRNDYDFFFKCDDDTYLFYENLAKELSKRDPNIPFMMGHRFLRFLKGGYFSGGAGYVLSRAALIRLVEQAIDKHPDCPTKDEDKEDVKMSICGRAVGIKNVDALGDNKISKFACYQPEALVRGSKWLEGKTRTTPFVREAISYHYVNASTMYLLHFVGYFLDVFQS